MGQLKKIVSIEKLSLEVLEALQEKYPEGWDGLTTKIKKADGSFFHAITLEFQDTSYLVKVPVEVDSFENWDKDEDLHEFVDQIDKKSIEKELEEDGEDDDPDLDDIADEDDDDEDDEDDDDPID